MTKRRVDNRLDDLRLRIGLADAFQAVVGADPYQHRVLAAGGFLFDRRNAKQLADDIRNFHRAGCGFNEGTEGTATTRLGSETVPLPRFTEVVFCGLQQYTMSLSA